MRRFHVSLVLMIILIANVAAWYFLRPMDHSTRNLSGQSSSDKAAINGVVQDQSGKKVKYWYDPMVPNQKFDKPGKSPFMDMQLVPKYAGEGGNASVVTIPAVTQQNLGIRIVPVSKSQFGTELSAVGRIEADERRIFAVQTRAPGFVERLYVRAVGDLVNKGQKIAELYAPDLLSAQKEYLALQDMEGVDDIHALKQAARSRLKLLGMTDTEINAITKSSHAQSRIGIYSPTSGVVTEIGAREGAQLMSGSTLILISDLSKVWLIAEIPEREAGRIEPGTEAVVELQSRQDEPVAGKVSYIYPTLNETTRTLRVRIELANPKGRLSPGMFANISFKQSIQEALAVPTESIIATGRRKVVIVKNEQGFRPVEIETGLEGNGMTQVVKGLAAGEQIVVSGQFLIDSEASLSGVLARLSLQDQSTPAAGEMAGMQMQSSPTAAKMPKGTGKVVQIDNKTSEITLAHSPIPEIGWPSMTMAFKVKDAKQLQALKSGDQVEFSLKSEDGGDEYRIEHIQKQDAMKGPQ